MSTALKNFSHIEIMLVRSISEFGCGEGFGVFWYACFRKRIVGLGCVDMHVFEREFSIVGGPTRGTL